MIKDAAELTKDRDGIGAAKFVCFCNSVNDNPFMAGAFCGYGEPDCALNVGVSGPGVVMAAIENLPKDVKERINDVYFVSGEDFMGFVDLKDEYILDEMHTFSFKNRKDLIEIVREAEKVE